MNNLDGVMQALLKRRHLITQTPAFPKCPICTSATPCIFYTSSSQISSQSRLSMVQSFRMSSQSLPSFFAFFYSSTSNITVINCFSISLFVASLLSILLFFSFFPFAVIASLIISLSLSLICSERVIYTATTHTEQSRAEQSGEGSLTCQNGHHLRNTTKLFSPLCFIYPSTTHLLSPQCKLAVFCGFECVCVCVRPRVHKLFNS